MRAGHGLRPACLCNFSIVSHNFFSSVQDLSNFQFELLHHFFTNDVFDEVSWFVVPPLQYTKKNLYSTNLPAINIDKDSEATGETILLALRRALSQYSSLQGPDGHWPGDYSGILFILPLMV
jgi:achilleol B synthase